MKKLIFSIAIASASLLNAQNNEMPNQNELNDLCQVLFAKTKVHSYDPNFSIEMGGKGLAHYIIQSDSVELFSLLGKKGFFGCNVINYGELSMYFRAYGSNLEDPGFNDSLYLVYLDGKLLDFRSQQPGIDIMKGGLQKEFKLAKGANFKVIKIELEKDPNDSFIREFYEYLDINNQMVLLEAEFLNGQLQGICFRRL